MLYLVYRNILIMVMRSTILVGGWLEIGVPGLWAGFWFDVMGVGNDLGSVLERFRESLGGFFEDSG